jgi:hypothetical protein
MKKMILLAALALAWPAWGQAPAPKPEAVKSAEAVKPAKAAKVAKKKVSAKRHQDARHCLQRADNDAIIRCAEEYL